MIASDIPHIAAHLLEQHGLAQRGWRFEWDRAKVRAGCCQYRKKAITLSRHYVELNVAEHPEDIVDTILHEIAHALAPGDGHGKKWKAACSQVGAVPKRCYDSDVVDMPERQLVAKCPNCGKEFRRHKQPRAGTWRYHEPCGPERGRLTFVHQDHAQQPGPQVRDEPPPPTVLR